MTQFIHFCLIKSSKNCITLEGYSIKQSHVKDPNIYPFHWTKCDVCDHSAMTNENQEKHTTCVSVFVSNLAITVMLVGKYSMLLKECVSFTDLCLVPFQ